MNAKNIIKLAQQKKLTITTAESVTGGLIAKTITDTPSASKIFAFGFITYSDEAKHKMLGVPQKILKKYGAVSKETVASMAEGATNRSNADIAIAVSGIASNGSEKNLGVVFIAIKTQSQTKIIKKHFKGRRKKIREQTAKCALTLLEETIKKWRK